MVGFDTGVIRAVARIEFPSTNAPTTAARFAVLNLFICLSMRMQIRRFTGLTNAFSKKLGNHAAAVAMHFAHYNFCRVHQTLRVTPAMEAGLTDTSGALSNSSRCSTQPTKKRPSC